MRKNVLSLSIAAMIGGLGFARPDVLETYYEPQKFHGYWPNSGCVFTYIGLGANWLTRFNQAHKVKLEIKVPLLVLQADRLKYRR